MGAFYIKYLNEILFYQFELQGKKEGINWLAYWIDGGIKKTFFVRKSENPSF